MKPKGSSGVPVKAEARWMGVVADDMVADDMVADDMVADVVVTTREEDWV